MSPQAKPNHRANPADRLSKPAARLLSALAEEGVSAVADPSRDGFILLRGRTGGVSLGRGSHPVACLDELERRDLAAPTGRGRGRAREITSAGLAWLRRERERRAGGDGFAGQHRETATGRLPFDGRPEAERARAGKPAPEDGVTVNLRESPLVWLRRRRGPDGEPLIDAAAFEAGERLRRDITMAGLLPSVTARWDGAVGGGAGAVNDPAAASDAVIAARQRVRSALRAVGAEFAGLLLDLCCFLKGLETIERERHWPQRSGKIVIGLALGQLARHYGLSNEARGRASRGIETWFADERA